MLSIFVLGGPLEAPQPGPAASLVPLSYPSPRSLLLAEQPSGPPSVLAQQEPRAAAANSSGTDKLLLGQVW
jgi:hypothetical protein